MKTYVSSLLVSAMPMTRLEYNNYRGWLIPIDEDPEDAGFLLENHKGNSNHSKHKGYISWLPLQEFKAQYTEVDNAEGQPAYKQRVLAELTELLKKLGALKAFFNSDLFLKCSQTERALLQQQCRLMTSYTDVLESRLVLMK